MRRPIWRTSAVRSRSNLAAADDVAAQRVQTLAWVHQARAAQLSRSAASLTAQYGPDDPGVKSAEAAVAAANATAAQVAVVHYQVTTADPQVAANGWALHGRVFDAQLAPASGYTVFLVDSSKTYQQAYGFAYTDSTGYFLLNYAGSAGASGKTPTAASGQNSIGGSPASRDHARTFRRSRRYQDTTGVSEYDSLPARHRRRDLSERSAHRSATHGRSSSGDPAGSHAQNRQEGEVVTASRNPAEVGKRAIALFTHPGTDAEERREVRARPGFPPALSRGGRGLAFESGQIFLESREDAARRPWRESRYRNNVSV